MTRRVMDEVSEERVRVRPGLGWMYDATVEFGNRGMTAGGSATMRER